MSEANTTAIFVAGYEKGRADALAQVLMVMQIAMDYYPSEIPPSARAILPADTGAAFCQMIHAFGNRSFRSGKRNQKQVREKETQSDIIPLSEGLTMKLKAKKQLTHGGKTHQPGESFDVPDHEAHNLIQSGQAEEHKEEHKEESHGQSQSGPPTPPFSTGGKPSGS